MKTVLLISSFVSASSVGAGVSAFCLQRAGHRVITLPTVLMGRHPGWGAPGGGPVSAARLKSMWKTIEAQNIQIDAVMTGYMASPAQVRLVGQIIDVLAAKNPNVLTLTDPVMGDHGRLYVGEDTARAIAKHLVPRAQVITPNLFELSRLTGEAIKTPRAALSAAKQMEMDVLVSSVPFEGKLGALLQTQAGSWQVSHRRFDQPPHGSGDILSAAYLAYVLGGDAPQAAFQKSISAVFDIVKTACENDMSDLPLIARQNDLVHPNLLTLKGINND